MKRFIFFVFLAAIAGLGRFIGCSPEKDPVNNTNDLNDQLAEDKLTNRDVADLLVKLADASMTDAQEGWLAVEKGSSRAVRNYGKLMMKDQGQLLLAIQKLAKKKNVTLPPAISHKKERGRKNLADETGRDFDAKYIKMMTTDQERDIKLFRKAMNSSDADVRVFAQKYLPMIELHLEQIQAIKTGS
jgi:putative membrane protein